MLFLLIIAILSAGFLVVQSQDTNSRNYPQKYFPWILYCPDVPAGSGPEWTGLTIGESTVQELISKVGVEPILLDNGAWLIYLPERYIYFCESNQIITSIKVASNSFDTDEQLYIDDLIAFYGVPDATAYVLGLEYSRVFFWFEDGIAAEVFVYDKDANFRRVTALVFLPYQALEDFESRYPYNRTCGDTFCGEPFFGYEPEQLNPFNFDEMLLTVTAQPTRTLTPVFTPYRAETGVNATETLAPHSP